MRFDLFGADRLKRSQADVQSDFCLLHPALSKLGEDLRSEVEASRGSGDRTSFAGVHGLIPVVIRAAASGRAM